MSTPRTPDEVIARLAERFGETVPLRVTGEGRSARVIADREHLLPVLEFLKSDSALAFDVLTDLTAVDRLGSPSPELGGARFVLVYQLDSTVHRHRFRVVLRIPADDLVAPSAAWLWPAARWPEREVFDLFGIEFDDHPDLRRILLSEAYPGYPLRKDEPPEGTTHRDAFLETLGSRDTRSRTSTSRANGGANGAGVRFSYQHPAMNGAIGLSLNVEGDSVRSADVEVGFQHHGFEKILESLPYEEGVGICTRIRPDCSRVRQASASALGFAVACEEALGVVPPRRAQGLRVILAELMRLAQHLDTLRLQALTAGVESLASELAERFHLVDDTLAKLAGGPAGEPLFKLGGLRRDPPATALEGLSGILRDVPPFLSRFAEETLSRRLLAMRLRGVGRVTRDVAVERGLTGPSLRASGVAYDVRRVRPYCGYDRYDFQVPTQEGGDAWARFVQRVEECTESLRIVALARDELTEGPVDLDRAGENGDAVEGGPTIEWIPGTSVDTELYSSTETATGELGFFLVSMDPYRPYRARIRAPSFYHAGFLPDLLTGEKLADVPAIAASFGLVAGEIDR